ncbi:TetR/AcrR family transcriptional regulator [Candidatus Pacebacteria bacterium]|nr:TetR/AcrR family transcriptional regulator [Candidatus Paceibacterota bacterium]
MKKEEKNTKEDILEAAQELFSSRGYKATSMSEIAKKVGITKPSLYYFFKNKQDIYLSFINSVILEIISIYKKTEVNTKNPKESIKKVLEDTLNFSIKKRVMLSLVGESDLDKDTSLFKDVLKNTKKMDKEIESFLKRCSVSEVKMAKSLITDSAHGYLCRKEKKMNNVSIKVFSEYISNLITLNK